MGIFKVATVGFKLGLFATKVAGGVAISSLKGINTVLDMTNESLDKINKKDWTGLEKSIYKNGDQICNAIGYKIDSLCRFGNVVEKSIREKDLDGFISKENTKLAVTAIGTGLAAIGVGVGIDSLDNELEGEGTNIGSLSFMGSDDIPIDNGVFVGNETELINLIQAGELEGTTHIDSDDITRDLSIRNDFLQSHGYTNVPEGYEVHHVVPLSEGGNDSASNMVLVTKEQHDIITSEHAKFYGW